MKPGKLYGVGIGPGDPRYLTLRAADVLRSVDVIFTVISQNAQEQRFPGPWSNPSSHAEKSISRSSACRVTRPSGAAQVQANADAIITELKAGRDCAFATLGDAMTYSTFGYVLEIIRESIPGVELEIVPGITSFATLTAKAGTVLVENGEQLRVIPSFKSEMAETLDFPKGSTTILLKTYRSRKALVDASREENVEILYGEHLAMEGQTLLTDLDAVADRPEEYLSLIMVKKQ